MAVDPKTAQIEAFLALLREESLALGPLDSVGFRDWLSAKAVASASKLSDAHFFLFLEDSGESVRIAGHKAFGSFEDYRDYGADLPGTACFCGFPGSDPSKIVFGVKTKSQVSKVGIDVGAQGPVAKIESFRDRKAKSGAPNTSEFFQAIGEALAEAKADKTRAAS
jgi:hypothetical protein